MINKEKVCACIVLYNPDIGRLQENLSAICSQVREVYLINNGSENFSEIKGATKSFINICLIDLAQNTGIAKALNEGCRKAIDHLYEWVITLDQDSVCYPHLIERYLQYTDLDDVGQMSCLIKDRNSKTVDAFQGEYKQVEWAITSASFVRLSAWTIVNGYDEKLFIDGVDYDFSLSLAEHGYKTIQINYCGLLHEIGKISKQIRICGKTHPVYNHNATRRYYICRNSIYLARKHRQLSVFRAFMDTLARILFVFIFENRKYSKLKAGLKGVFDGFAM